MYAWWNTNVFLVQLRKDFCISSGSTYQVTVKIPNNFRFCKIGHNLYFWWNTICILHEIRAVLLVQLRTDFSISSESSYHKTLKIQINFAFWTEDTTSIFGKYYLYFWWNTNVSLVQLRKDFCISSGST